MTLAILSGFLSSLLLYEPTHREHVPELARYGVGGVVVMIAYALLYPGDDTGLRRISLALSCAGVGVGAARVLRMLL